MHDRSKNIYATKKLSPGKRLTFFLFGCVMGYLALYCAQSASTSEGYFLVTGLGAFAAGGVWLALRGIDNT